MEQGMLNENQNSGDWKARLEDPQGLPEACVQNKDAAWQQLQARLQPPRKKNNTAWRLAAAACLLAVISLPMLTAKKDPAITVNKKPSPPAVNEPIALRPLPTRETTIINSTVVLISAKQLNNSVNKTRIKKLPFRAPVVSQLPPSPEVTIQVVNNPPLVATRPIAVATVKHAPALSPAKKLKVVHVNELGAGMPDAYPMVRMEDTRTTRLKLINHEIFSNGGTGAMGSGVNIFKSKNTPTN